MSSSMKTQKIAKVTVESFGLRADADASSKSLQIFVADSAGAHTDSYHSERARKVICVYNGRREVLFSGFLPGKPVHFSHVWR